VLVLVDEKPIFVFEVEDVLVFDVKYD